VCSKTAAPPEDAPHGHIVYEKLKCWRDTNVFFHYPVGGTRVEFALSLRMCRGSREEAERILRLCYLKFEEGKSKLEVMQYRNLLLEQRGLSARAVAGEKRKAAGPSLDGDAAISQGESNVAEGADSGAAADVSSAASPAPASKAAKAAAQTPAAGAKRLARRAAGLDAAKPSQPAAMDQCKAATGGSKSSTAPTASTAAVAARSPLSSTQHDLPTGHVAYERVRHEGEDAVFEFEVPGGPPVVFRTSAAVCRGSIEEAARISRLCYARFEEGRTEQEVRCFKNMLLSGCSFMMLSAQRPCASPEPKVGDDVAAEESQDSQPAAKSVRKRKRLLSSKTVASPEPTDKQAGAGNAPLRLGALRPGRKSLGKLEDAPEGHEAHSKVKHQRKGNEGVAHFHYDTADGKVPFQTTAGACGGSRAEAQRIARLCYMKFQEGLSKQDVLRYRNRLYEQCLKRAAVGEKPASVEDAPEGHTAHRKCSTSPDGKVVSFTHVFTQGAPYICFQTTTGRCGGSLKEAERICRLCFMKFELGWSKDEVLRFREHEYRRFGLSRLCRGGMFTKLATFYRTAGAASTSTTGFVTPPADGDDGGATPRETSPPAEAVRSKGSKNEATPEKEGRKGKRCGGSPLAPTEKQGSSSSEQCLESATCSQEAAGALARPSVVMPWPALHETGASQDAEQGQGKLGAQRDGMKGLAHMLRSSDTSAQTALHKRFCKGRRLQVRREGGMPAMEMLQELEHCIAPVTGLVINEMLLHCGESLALADVIASQTVDSARIWKEVPADEVR